MQVHRVSHPQCHVRVPRARVNAPLVALGGAVQRIIAGQASLDTYCFLGSVRF